MKHQTHDASLSAEEWLRLHCYARNAGAEHLELVFDAVRPPQIAAACDNVTTMKQAERPWVVTAGIID